MCLRADSCKRLISLFILMEGAASQSLNYKGRPQDPKLWVRATCHAVSPLGVQGCLQSYISWQEIRKSTRSAREKERGERGGDDERGDGLMVMMMMKKKNLIEPEPRGLPGWSMFGSEGKLKKDHFFMSSFSTVCLPIFVSPSESAYRPPRPPRSHLN